MAGVEAEPDPRKRARAESANDGGEIFEGSPNRGAGPGGELQQHCRALLHLGQGALHRLGISGDAARHVPIGGVSWMSYDEVDPERRRSADLAGEAREGPLPKSRVG